MSGATGSGASSPPGGEVAGSFRARDGAVLGYRLWRPGAPRRLLVLLHGVASNMTRWSEFVTRTRLAGSWDLLRLDLRGHGRSVHRGRLGMAEWCADLAALLDAEGYREAVVAGHCLGANIAVEFAVRHPGRAMGLVLIEPMLREALAGPFRRVARLRPLFRLLGGLARGLNALGLRRRRLAPLDLEALDREMRAVLGAGGTAGDLWKRYASPLLDLRTTPTGAYLAGLVAVSGRLPDLSAVRAPVLALLSTSQAFTDPARTERGLAALGDCRVLRLDALHWIPTERPEEMRRAIEEWCRRWE